MPASSTLGVSQTRDGNPTATTSQSGDCASALDAHPNAFMTAERLQWLELIARFGPLEWKGQLPGNAAAHCREAGWTQVRMIKPSYRFLHDLTDAGRSALLRHSERPAVNDCGSFQHGEIVVPPASIPSTKWMAQ